VHSASELLRAIHEQLAVDSPVKVIEEDGLAIVAALDVMHWNAGDNVT
jgi:hypothetical protein